MIEVVAEQFLGLVQSVNHSVSVQECQDLICMIDGNGEPFTIPNFREGMEIDVFALPAHELWGTEKGISIFGPRAMGYDVDYKPL